MKNSTKNNMTNAVVKVITNSIVQTVKSNKESANLKRIEFLAKAKNEKQEKVINDKSFYYVPSTLLGTSKKTEKGDGLETGFLTKILYLSPAFLSGFNTCSKATTGCSSACLNVNGNGRYNNTQIARINKTKFFYLDRNKFMRMLIKEIKMFIVESEFEGLKPVIRLNGTSDLNLSLFKYEGAQILDMFKEVTFYDYTKVLNRFNKEIQSNYFLTASRDESNEIDCLELLNKGVNVAFVFNIKKDQELPKEYKGFKVVNGDKNDLRHLDYENNKDSNKGVIVGLFAKGKAKTDKTGFTINL